MRSVRPRSRTVLFEYAVQLNVVDTLLRGIANTQYSSSQRESAVALSRLCHSSVADVDQIQQLNERLAVIVGPHLHQLILVSIRTIRDDKGRIDLV